MRPVLQLGRGVATTVRRFVQLMNQRGFGKGDGIPKVEQLGQAADRTRGERGTVSLIFRPEKARPTVPSPAVNLAEPSEEERGGWGTAPERTCFSVPRKAERAQCNALPAPPGVTLGGARAPADLPTALPSVHRVRRTANPVGERLGAPTKGWLEG